MSTKSLIVGAHMSIAKGFADAARITGEVFQAHAMQFFTKSPRGRAFKMLNLEDVKLFQLFSQKYQLRYIIVHSSYLLNFAADADKIPWAFDDILLDFRRLQALGGHGVVVHIGKSLNDDRSKAIQKVIENTKRVLDLTENTGLDYILENTAGQGSEIGFRFEELGQIWKGLKGFNPRLKSCLDTAHVWAAGYDFSHEQGVQQMLQEYDELIGLNTLSCFHFNDSLKLCGSRVDRHANIGDGKIGLEGLKALARWAATHQVPLILETPETKEKDHAHDIALVKSWFES